MYWRQVHTWSPFKIDALGLLSILGADEMNYAIGSLTQSSVTDCLPFLAAHVVASNQFTAPVPGFYLYNISDGIMATDLAGWFTKWLLRCELTDNSTIISISYSTRKLSLRSRLCAFVLGICAISPVLIVASLSRDWWGLANVTSMAVSVVVRQNALAQNREALDAAVAGNKGSLNEEVKVFITMPTGPAVTIKASRGIVINCLLSNPKPSHKVLYKVVLAIGWVAFGCHVVTIGMTTLVCQILSVALLLVAMLLKTNGFGDAQDHIGSCLSLEKKVAPGKDSRAAAYARFDLSQKEEASMSRWNLFPHKSNEHWWEKYRKCTEDKSLKSFYDWDKELPRDSPRLLSKIDVQRRLSA